MIGTVPEQMETRRASRYDAVIATFVGLCALCVSTYTAYVQRQQVRAAVWPILEFGSSNAPDVARLRRRLAFSSSQATFRHGREAYRLQEALNGKPVDWMEKVSDEQYRIS